MGRARAGSLELGLQGPSPRSPSQGWACSPRRGAAGSPLPGGGEHWALLPGLSSQGGHTLIF